MASRREFLSGAAASLIVLCNPSAVLAAGEVIQSPALINTVSGQEADKKHLPSLEERISFLTRRSAFKRDRGGERTLFEISGIHNNPYPGGIEDIDLFLTDVVKFGFKPTGHKTLNPTRELILKSAEHKIPMVARIQTEDGLFHKDQLKELVTNLLESYRDPQIPVSIQIGNEPNLGNADTGDKFYEPEEYAEKMVLPSIGFIAEESGGRIKSITPPIAPNPTDPEAYLHGYSPAQYLYYLLLPLAERYSIKFILDNVKIGGNYYIFHPGQKPWDEIRKLAIGVAFDAFKTFIPTVALEGGLNQESTPGREFTHEQASIPVKASAEKMPPDIDAVLSEHFWWIYRGGNIYDFTLCEWVNKNGEYNPEALTAIKTAEKFSSKRPSTN